MRRTAKRANQALSPNSLSTLGFHAIRELLAGFSGTEVARAAARELQPDTSPEVVSGKLMETSEARVYLAECSQEPFSAVPAIGPLIGRAQPLASRLEPGELQAIARFAAVTNEIAARIGSFERAPTLRDLAGRVPRLADLADRIERVILPSGGIADDATPALAETRRRLAREQARLAKTLDELLADTAAGGTLQERLLTTRNDRTVLVVKAEQRRRLPGIVHGSSGSGASVFVEPLATVELNNEIVGLKEAEQREIVRVLRELTAHVRERRLELEEAESSIARLDSIQARALLSRELDGTRPELVTTGDVELRGARHPLLVPRIAARLGVERGEDPVPVTLRLLGDQRILIISGPNTGGKTVALKTVGLLVLMAQCGIHPPVADGSRLPVFKRVFADIGDEQSIEQSLSTFSSHILAIAGAMEGLELPSLVLLDELGSGTDPGDGGALGVSIVDHFNKVGAHVVATTHHGALKRWALETAGVQCAAFGYDPESYVPTYELQYGTPGRSLAFEVAARYDLPASVLAEARRRRDSAEARIEDLLEKLERERVELFRERDELAKQRREIESRAARDSLAAERERDELRGRIEKIEGEVRAQADRAAKQAGDAIRAAVERLDQRARPSRSGERRARETARRAVREAHLGVLRGLEQPLARDPRADLELTPGSQVRIASLGVTGELVARSGDRDAWVVVRGKRIQVPASELTPLPGELASRPARSGGVRTPSVELAPAEINLVGLRVDEAVPQVDRLLDQAAMSDRPEVRVIHGFGTGRLRKAVGALLDGHPHVATHRPGGAGEGGGGVTVVRLKGH